MFTIDSENNIAAHATTPVNVDNLRLFASEKALAKLAADGPAARLIEIWNGFAGVVPFDDLKPVKKFTSRATVGSRFWAAVQRLEQPYSTAVPSLCEGDLSSRNGVDRTCASPMRHLGPLLRVADDPFGARNAGFPERDLRASRIARRWCGCFALTHYKKGAPFKVGLRRRLGTDGKEHPSGQQKVYWHGRASGKHLDCGQ